MPVKKTHAADVPHDMIPPQIMPSTLGSAQRLFRADSPVFFRRIDEGPHGCIQALQTREVGRGLSRL